MTRTSVYFSVSSVARNVSVKILVCGCVSYPPTGIYYLCIHVHASRNAVTLVWGSLRLAPIIFSPSEYMLLHHTYMHAHTHTHTHTHTYQLLVVADGGSAATFHYSLDLPPPSSSSSAWTPSTQYFIGGGAVSTHTAERHFKLVNAENTQLSWKLGSLQVLQGMSTWRWEGEDIHSPSPMIVV